VDWFDRFPIRAPHPRDTAVRRQERRPATRTPNLIWILVDVAIDESRPGCPVEAGSIIEMPFLVENCKVTGIVVP